MTKEELAALLDGRKYGNETTIQERKEARAARLVVVFGYSDDNVEFNGAIDDEYGCGDGSVLLVHREGVCGDFTGFDYREEAEAEAYFKNKGRTLPIMVRWCPEGDPSWTYETQIPHATFRIWEKCEMYCIGIVFSIDDLPE